MIRKVGLYGLLILFCTFCQPPNQEKHMSEDSQNKKANRLINSSSPYLRQHAYNPVDWYPWGEEALKKANEEDKPILVSIGYSSCHWCHVMERESFENDTIAALMNKYFISIKVDREERPDVDQIYMDAVHAMGQQGGWPLNVFLTPDQQPFYGGTYFPPQGWAQLLQNIAAAFKDRRADIEKSAGQLTNMIATSDLIKYNFSSGDESFPPEKLDTAFQSMAEKFDAQRGGFNRAPKFPMPSNWLFLLRYAHQTNNQQALQQVEKTLDEMAQGGIYDQAGGGFARYSVDDKWLVPHFEKMLYDNGQLLSLYSEAFMVTQKPLYERVVQQTVEWLEREMLSEGGFYAALDADSDGEEGKFYVWTQHEIQQLLGEDAELIMDYYTIQENGNWEHGKNILHRTESDESFAKSKGLTLKDLHKITDQANAKFLKERTNRIRPGLDDKILAGWNGLTMKGLADAYAAFGEEKYRELAVGNAEFIKANMLVDGQLKRSYKDGKASIDAYLEDYAFVIQGLLSVYQITFDEQWLELARQLTDYTLEHFFDEEEHLFFYTDDSSSKLIARKKELFDNVIPSSNSQMGINLYFLGSIYDKKHYTDTATKMLSQMSNRIDELVTDLSNWAILYSYVSSPTAEIVVIGDKSIAMSAKVMKKYHPNKIMMGSLTASELPLLKDKVAIDGKTTIYVCFNKTCKLPVTSVEEALEQIH